VDEPGAEPGEDFIHVEESPRVVMNCGHKFASSSIRWAVENYCKRETATIPIMCPAITKNVGECLNHLWDWNAVILAGCFTKAEIKKYDRIFSENLIIQTMNGARCPECKSISFRDPSMKRVVCPVCVKDKKPYAEFCATCGTKWKGNSCPRCAEITRQLADSPLKSIDSQMVPRMRACPRAHTKPVVMEHKDKCKHMVCPSCNLDFCFACLSLRQPGKQWPDECSASYSAVCKKGVALPQKF